MSARNSLNWGILFCFVNWFHPQPPQQRCLRNSLPLCWGLAALEGQRLSPRTFHSQWLPVPSLAQKGKTPFRRALDRGVPLKGVSGRKYLLFPWVLLSSALVSSRKRAPSSGFVEWLTFSWIWSYWLPLSMQGWGNGWVQRSPEAAVVLITKEPCRRQLATLRGLLLGKEFTCCLHGQS